MRSKYSSSFFRLSYLFGTLFFASILWSFGFLTSAYQTGYFQIDFLPTFTAEALPSPPESPQTDVHISSTTAQYVEILDSCNTRFEGSCAHLRSGPGAEFPAIVKIRSGAVLKVDSVHIIEGAAWYRIQFDEWLRYPERVSSELYVSAAYVRPFIDLGIVAQKDALPKNAKRIVIDRSDQMLRAYDGDTLYMEEFISTGVELTPTPLGHFRIYQKTPTRYMQGPIPNISDKTFDLPGVPWNLYFTSEGAVIHGAYWHDGFGKPHSNGCVNLPPEMAKRLYQWADIGTHVYVNE